MKKTITISIDLDVYLELKRQKTEISKVINEYLVKYTAIPEEKDTSENKLQAEADKLQAKALKLKAKIEKMKKEREDKHGKVIPLEELRR